MRGSALQAKGSRSAARNPRAEPIGIVADVVVGETQDMDAEPFQNIGPPGVVLRVPFMLFAVDLDDELGRVAVEIDDEAIEGDLPPELRAVEARTAQTLPRGDLPRASDACAGRARIDDARWSSRPPSRIVPSPPAPLPPGEGARSPAGKAGYSAACRPPSSPAAAPAPRADTPPCGCACRARSSRACPWRRPRRRRRRLPGPCR